MNETRYHFMANTLFVNRHGAGIDFVSSLLHLCKRHLYVMGYAGYAKIMKR